MTQSFQTPDGCRLAYDISGQGPAVLWQHGLGATAAQPAEVFPEGFTRITLLCRGHDGSDLGDPASLSIAQFGQDVLALMDHLGLQSVAMGGISLGAAIALRLAVTHPLRVRALILARPAWVDHPAPETMQSYVEVARQLARHGELGRVSLPPLCRTCSRMLWNTIPAVAKGKSRWSPRSPSPLRLTCPWLTARVSPNRAG
jgi:pimeloyl-ACP methyl ester carboxylesterase